MKRFLRHILLFTGLLTGVLVVSLFFVPDVVSETSILAAIPEKHAMLRNSKAPRILFVGGSNVSFGLDSKTIRDSLHKPVLNLGVHAGLGLEYIVNDVKPYLQCGDTLVLMPEYEHFYTDNFYGEMELVSVLFGVDPNGRKQVDMRQWMHLLKYLPPYAAKKIRNAIPVVLHGRRLPEQVNIYDKRSFNEFGDACIHWAMPDQDHQPAPKHNGKERVNPHVLSFLKTTCQEAKQQGVTVLILPPVIEDESYDRQQTMVAAIADSLQANGIGFLTNPVRYRFPGNYFFNSYYHLNKPGVDVRTQLVIQDLKPQSARP